MKAFEFQSCIGPDNTVTIPAALAAEIEREQPVRVILLVPEADEDREWAALTTEQFLKGYAESDAIYDDLGERQELVSP